MLLFMFILGSQAATFRVNMQNIQFVPRNLTINVGDTVVWTNLDFTTHDTVSGTNGVPSNIWRSPLFGRNGTYSFTFTNVPPGGYGYYCTPHVFLGMAGTITILPPNLPPSVAITNPADGAAFAVGQPILVEASADDPNGSVARVDFFVNGAPAGSDASAPYSLSLNNLVAGNYSLSAIAVDNQGAVSSPSVVNISVQTGNLPPFVSITNPVNGQTFFPSDLVLVEVSAVDPDGTVNQVELRTNGVSAGIITITPYAFTLSNLTIGDYALQAVAADNLGAAATSAVVSISVVLTPEPPEILTPPQSQTVAVGSTVAFEVSAGGTPPLNYQWLFNGTELPTATAASLFLTNVQPGQAGLYSVRVSNSVGSTTSPPASLVVDLPPAILITNPPNGAIFAAGSDVSVDVQASDPDGQIAQVDLFLSTNPLSTNLVATLTNPPFSFVLTNVVAGTYVLRAAATDDAGLNASSPEVLFFVRNAPVLTRSPADPAVPLGIDVLLEATVDDTAGPITNVIFLAGNTVIGQDSSPPYTLLWQPPQLGDFLLTAIAVDAAGQTNSSNPNPIRIFIAESTRPTITLTNFTRISNPSVLAAGVASDNVALDSVEYQLNTGPWQVIRSNIGSPDVSWTVNIQLDPGQNAIRFRSVDYATNVSFELTRFVTYVVHDELRLSVQGAGSVQPNLDQVRLELGKAYTVRARPAPGHLFAGWQPFTNARNPVLSFQMEPNLALVARFATNLFPAAVGTYNGLFFETNHVSPETSGFITLQLANKGSFSGKLRIDGKSFPFKSQFDPAGNAAFVVIRQGKTPLILGLQIDLAGAEQIHGFVTNAVGTNGSLVIAELTALRAMRPAKALAGPRSFRLREITAEGERHAGQGVLEILAGRGARIRISMNQQPALMVATSVSQSGALPLYLPTAEGRQLLTGWLQLGPFDLLPGTVFWATEGLDPVRLEVIPEAP